VPIPFAFARLNALQAAVKHSNSLSDPCLCKVTQANWTLTAFKKNIEQQLTRKGLNCNDSPFQVLGAFGNLSLENLGDAFMNLSSATGNLVLVYHWIQFVELISKPTKEPTGKPTKRTELPNILTSKQGKYSLSEKQDAELPSKITVSITQFSSNTSCTFEAVHGVSHVHVKYIMTSWVTFSDGRDNEIQSMCPDESLPQPNEWQMPDKINLDSSGLQQSTRTEILHLRDKVYSHSTLKKLK
jgi:hypothetical protein